MRVSGKAENMFTPELATDRIQDLVREAEAQRLSGSVHAAHAGLEGTTARLAHGLTHGALAAERFFHVAHHEVRQGLRGARVATQAY